MERVNKDVYTLAKSIIGANVNINKFIDIRKRELIYNYKIDESLISTNTKYSKLYNDITTLRNIINANKDYLDVMYFNYDLNNRDGKSFLVAVEIIKKVMVF
jgi:hypothetical protein